MKGLFKICFLAPADSVHSYRWLKFFADRKYEISWISLVKNQFEEGKNVKFYPLKSFFLKPVGGKFLDFLKVLNIVLSIKSIRKLLLKINPDILHAHGVGINGMIAALSDFHPFVLTAWGSDILMAKNLIKGRPFKKYILKKADLITCDAEHMKAAMVKLGAEESKIRIINFGVDTKAFSPGEKDLNLERKLGILGAETIISVRRLEKFCDVETLIKAAPLILKDFPEAKFIIVGRGTLENSLKEKARSLGVEKNIRFLGAIPNEELPKYLRLSRVFVSTALSDAGVASSTAEAMASGLPVVITDVADNKNWIQEGKNGFLIPVKNPEALAEKIVWLLKNKEAGKKMGELNRKIIEEKNNYYKEMEKMENIYKQLINKKHD